MWTAPPPAQSTPLPRSTGNEGDFFLLYPYGDDVPGKSQSFIIRHNLLAAAILAQLAAALLIFSLWGKYNLSFGLWFNRTINFSNDPDRP